MINKTIQLSNGNVLSRVNGTVRMICNACAKGHYSSDSSDSCWRNPSNNVSLEAIDQVVQALKHGDPPPKVEFLNHRVEFKTRDGKTIVVIGCTSFTSEEVEAVFEQLKALPDATLDGPELALKD